MDNELLEKIIELGKENGELRKENELLKEKFQQYELKGETKELLKEILEELRKPESNKIEKVTLTIAEAAKFSGFNDHKIRELIDKPNTDFPFFKVGKKTFINKAMLGEWIQKVSTEHRVI